MNEKHWDLINFFIFCLFFYYKWIIQLSKKESHVTTVNISITAEMQSVAYRN